MPLHSNDARLEDAGFDDCHAALELVEMLSAIIRGTTRELPNSEDGIPIEMLLNSARYNGVLQLCAAKLAASPLLCATPAGRLLTCRREFAEETIHELLRGNELESVLNTFEQAGIRTLLLKGAGLAYSLYASPLHRPRSDTDILVAPECRGSALQILEALGYHRTGGPAGALVGYQQQMQRVDTRGIIHNIDLHWRLSDAQSFAWIFDFDELTTSSTPVPALNPHARRLGNAHALLHSLIHRATNNQFQGSRFGDRLIWLYDMHLLVRAMTSNECTQFHMMTEAKRLVAIALDGLRACALKFPDPKLDALIGALERSPWAHAGATFLYASRLRREWLELIAIPGMRNRLKYLRERTFPSSDYMRERYPSWAERPIALLHTRRWLLGFWRLFGLR